MSRLEKKCFVGATGFHLLLLVILVVGPAFFVADKVDDSPVLEIIPTILTDEKVPPGGGKPAPKQPIQESQPQTQPAVQPPIQQPKPVEPVRQPDPPKVKPVKVANDDPDTVEPKPETKPRQVQISDKIVKLKQPAKPTDNSKPNTQTAENNERQQQLASALKNIKSGLSSGTEIKMPGPGGGGPTYANYKQEIQRIYKQTYDRALQAAGDIAEGRTFVETSVVILSDGTVVSSSIVKPSGNTALDNLTRRVLDSVRAVPPFPAGAKDSQRTFNIIFDLKPTNALG